MKHVVDLRVKWIPVTQQQDHVLLCKGLQKLFMGFIHSWNSFTGYTTVHCTEFTLWCSVEGVLNYVMLLGDNSVNSSAYH